MKTVRLLAEPQSRRFMCAYWILTGIATLTYVLGGLGIYWHDVQQPVTYEWYDYMDLVVLWVAAGTGVVSVIIGIYLRQADSESLGVIRIAAVCEIACWLADTIRSTWFLAIDESGAGPGVLQLCGLTLSQFAALLWIVVFIRAGLYGLRLHPPIRALLGVMLLSVGLDSCLGGIDAIDAYNYKAGVVYWYFVDSEPLPAFAGTQFADEVGLLFSLPLMLLGVMLFRRTSGYRPLRCAGVLYIVLRTLSALGLVYWLWHETEWMCVVNAAPVLAELGIGATIVVLAPRFWWVCAHRCAWCGYDLRGSVTHRCPECGRDAVEMTCPQTPTPNPYLAGR